MASMIDLVNAVLANAAGEYVAHVPQATQDNITAVGNAVLLYTPTTNAFLTTLINRIGLTVVKNRMINNPLKVLKQGGVPLGDSVQELFTNPAEDMGLGDGSDLLTSAVPDSYSLYHTMNRQGKFKVSISQAQLQRAFTSWDKFEEFINSIMTTLYSGDQLSEFILMKNLIADAIVTSKIPVFDLTGPITADGVPKELVKAIKNTSLYMTFPGSNFNNFKAIQAAQLPPVVTNDIITYCPQENQVLIIRADVFNEVTVEVLAAAFNLGKVEFQKNLIVVDSFGAATDALAVVADSAAFQVYDNYMNTTEFFNASNVTWTYYLHHWQTFSLSYFANCAAFKYTEEVPEG